MARVEASKKPIRRKRWFHPETCTLVDRTRPTDDTADKVQDTWQPYRTPRRVLLGWE